MTAGAGGLRLALLGDPVAHSRSPAIHAAALAAAGLVGSYEARAVDAAGFADALDDLLGGGLDGANVTMPHKRRAFAACSAVSADARQAGAVNTMGRAAGGVAGWNTDVDALRVALASMPAAPLLVLGAGAAAAAALVAAGDRQVRLAARRSAAAETLAGTVGAATAVPWGQGFVGSIVVNATPLGMAGESLPPAALAGCAGLIDFAYGDHPTPAVVSVGGRGLPVVDGLEMLVSQAAASFTIWTGQPAPREAMKRAARAG